MRMRQQLVSLALPLALLIGADLGAATGEPEYVNGGIGEMDVAHMQGLASRFPLRLTLSEGTRGAFVADVDVTIADARGREVLEVADAGPLLFVDLPSGRYRVTAEYQGRVETRTVQLAPGQSRQLSINWPGTPDME